MKLNLLLLILALVPSKGFANWTINLGVNNPPASDYGFNFLYKPGPLALEVGIGQFSTDVNITRDNEDNDRGQASFSGDVDVKYFLGKSSLVPYVSGGLLYGMYGGVGDGGGLGVGTGSTFLGAGLLTGSDKLYVYGGINLIHEHLELNFGLGIDI